MKKVLLIGIDGATWSLIMPWIKEGRLPALKNLIARGVYGELESTIPPNTIPAWNALATGKNPGNLGYFSWLTKLEGSYEFEPKFLHTREKAIWNTLSNMGKKVVVVNVPNLHKSSKINGHTVAGFLYLSQQDLTYPRDLKKRLDDITDGYEVDLIEGLLDIYQKNQAAGKPFRDALLNVRSMKNSRFLKKTYQVMDKHFKAFESLLKEQWDFAFIVFVAPDRIQHRFWGDKRVLLECYERLDIKLEKILDIIDGDTTIIVVSDHGFGPKKRVFCLNEWLLKEGYLHLKASVHRRLKVMKLMRIIGISKLLHFLTKILPSKLVLWTVENEAFRITPEKIDWKKTQVFVSPQSSAGEIYLNICGREREGTISSEKYKEVRSEIHQQLMNLVNPETGEKISATVYNKEDIYEGEYLSRAPDLVILQNDDINAFDTLLERGRIFSETAGEFGEHRVNGIFIASGPNVRTGKKIEGARIYDIAPTILHIFGTNQVDMDGRVLKEIFETETHARFEEGNMMNSTTETKEAPSVYSSDEQRRILDRLRSLGYID